MIGQEAHVAAKTLDTASIVKPLLCTLLFYKEVERSIASRHIATFLLRKVRVPYL